MLLHNLSDSDSFQEEKVVDNNELQLIIICQKIKDEIARLEEYRTDYSLIYRSSEQKINVYNRLLQLLIVPESFLDDPGLTKQYFPSNQARTFGNLVKNLMKSVLCESDNQDITCEKILTAPASYLSNEPEENAFIDSLLNSSFSNLKLDPVSKINRDKNKLYSSNLKKKNIAKKIAIDEVVIHGDSLTDEDLMFTSAFGKWCGLEGTSPKGSFTDGDTWLGYINMEVLDKVIYKAVKHHLQAQGLNCDSEAIGRFRLQNDAELKKQIKYQLTHNNKRNIFTISKFDRNDTKISDHDVSESYAIGGATAHSYRGKPSKSLTRYFTRLIVSTLADQRKLHLDDHASQKLIKRNKKLNVTWIGANDLITVNELPSMLEADNAVDDIFLHIKELIENGDKHFKLGNLPDLSLTPRYQAKSPEEQKNASLCTEYFNRKLAMAAAELQKMYPDCNIDVIDVNSKYKDIINGLRAGGVNAEPYKKYINKEYQLQKVDVLPSAEEVREDSATNRIYSYFDDNYNFCYVVIDPCGVPRNGQIPHAKLVTEFINKNLTINDLTYQILDYRNDGSMPKDSDLWTTIIGITSSNEVGHTVAEDDVFVELKKTKAFENYLDDLARANPGMARDKLIETVGCIPGHNVVFYDDVHPATRMHKFIHDEIMCEIHEEYIVKIPSIKLDMDIEGEPCVKEKKPKTMSKQENWTEAKAVAMFMRHYHQQFNEDRNGIFGFFRTRKLDWTNGKITLNEIFEHALNPDPKVGTGQRTKNVLVKLGWIDENGFLGGGDIDQSLKILISNVLVNKGMNEYIRTCS